MANTTTGNPWLIDTVTATAIVTAGTFFQLYALQWTSSSLADSLSVQEADGTVKYVGKGDVANYSERMSWPSNAPVVFNGLKVPTLDTGILRLYVKVLR